LITIANIQKKRGGFREVVLLVLELASGGEIFDFLMYTGKFSEIIARTYFKQLISALESCHTQGIFHRDLKPENLLLDKNYQLKVADFGLSYMYNQDELSSEERIMLHTQCGTQSYMAPEVIQTGVYEGSAADIWSSGVVLFILLAGNPPFQFAKQSDWWFNCISRGNYDRFWQAHLRSCPEFPREAQNFLNKIFVADSRNRFTINDIKNDPWFQKETLQFDELEQELVRRKQIVDNKKEIERQEALERKRIQLQNNNRFTKNVFRSTNLLLNVPKLPNYEINTKQDFYFYESADLILNKLGNICDQLENKTKNDVKENEFKIKTEVDIENVGKVSFTIQIYSNGNDLNSIKFQKKKW